MPTKNISKSSLFLMELIIVLLFFSLTSAICLQLFVRAHLLDQKTTDLNKAVQYCQNTCELYTALEGDVEALCSLLEITIPDEIQAKLGKEYLEFSTPLTDVYSITLSYDGSVNPAPMEITYYRVTPDGNTTQIYSLHSEYYTPAKAFP